MSTEAPAAQPITNQIPADASDDFVDGWNAGREAALAEIREKYGTRREPPPTVQPASDALTDAQLEAIEARVLRPKKASDFEDISFGDARTLLAEVKRLRAENHKMRSRIGQLRPVASRAANTLSSVRVAVGRLTKTVTALASYDTLGPALWSNLENSPGAAMDELNRRREAAEKAVDAAAMVAERLG